MRPVPLPQYGSRASAAGVSTTRHPQASVLAGGDYKVARKLFSSLEDLQYDSSLEDLQYDSRTSAAGVSTTRHHQASVLAGGDYGGEEAFRQPGGPAVNRSVHLSVRQEDDWEEDVVLYVS